MPDLSSVAREAAKRAAERLYPDLDMFGIPDMRCAVFIDGFTECASRIPSECEIEIAILGRTATQAAKAVRELIERGLGAPQD